MISPHTISTPKISPPSSEQVADEVVGVVASLAKLLSDETRVRILSLLAQHREMCVRDLWERLAQTQPGVSHHLALLREAGLVTARQAGRNVFYRLDPQRFSDLVKAVRRTPLGQALDLDK